MTYWEQYPVANLLWRIGLFLTQAFEVAHAWTNPVHYPRMLPIILRWIIPGVCVVDTLRAKNAQYRMGGAVFSISLFLYFVLTPNQSGAIYRTTLLLSFLLNAIAQVYFVRHTYLEYSRRRTGGQESVDLLREEMKPVLLAVVGIVILAIFIGIVVFWYGSVSPVSR